MVKVADWWTMKQWWSSAEWERGFQGTSLDKTHCEICRGGRSELRWADTRCVRELAHSLTPDLCEAERGGQRLLSGADTTRNLVQSLSLKQRTCVDRLGEMSAELIGPLTAAVCDPGADKAGTGAEDTLQGGWPEEHSETATTSEEERYEDVWYSRRL